MKNYLKTGILLIGVSLLLWNCEKDTNSITEPQKKLLKSQEFVSYKELPTDVFSSINEINPLISHKYTEFNYTLSIDWDKIIKVVDTLNNIKYSVKIKLKNESRNIFYNLIIGSNGSELITPYVLKYTIFNLQEIKKGDFFDFSKFKGTIETFNYQDFLKKLTVKSKYSKISNQSAPIVDDPCFSTTFTGGGDSAYDDNIITNVINSNEFYSGGSTGEVNYSNSSGSCTWLLVGFAEEGGAIGWTLFINCPIYDHENKGLVDPCPDIADDVVAVNPPDQIIVDSTFANYPCQEMVVTDAYGVCSPLTKLVLDVFESNDKTNLVFQTSAKIIGNGNTWHDAIYNPITKEYDITIRLRQSYLTTATDLSIARTVIHESVHGLMVQMHEEGKFNLPDGTVDPSFADMAAAYTKKQETNDASGLGLAQHEYMAKLVEDMATSLSAYGTQNGYNLPFTYYKNMAWGGLTYSMDSNNNVVENVFFTNAVPNYNDRMTIVNTQKAEQDNDNTLLDGNGNTISPKGNVANASTPCN